MVKIFRPKLIPVLLAFVFICLFVSLGFWQLERAEQKQQLMRQYEQRISAPPLDLATADAQNLDKKELYWRRANLHGRYDAQRAYLLDNRTLAGRSGYYLYTRFILRDGAEVLVNRGWLPLAPDRNSPPAFSTPGGELALTGVIKPPPRTLLLAEHRPEQLAPNITRLQEVVLAELARENGWSLLPYVIRLGPPAPDGLYRRWQPPGFGRERHLGYAFQWFAMAAALLVIYVVLTIRKSAKTERD